MGKTSWHDWYANGLAEFHIVSTVCRSSSQEALRCITSFFPEKLWVHISKYFWLHHDCPLNHINGTLLRIALWAHSTVPKSKFTLSLTSTSEGDARCVCCHSCFSSDNDASSRHSFSVPPTLLLSLLLLRLLIHHPSLVSYWGNWHLLLARAKTAWNNFVLDGHQNTAQN